MDHTIDYYNLNAENFIENTQNVDMHLAQDKFLHLLNEGAAILDFGCGSGRDTSYFLDKDYQVTATDGSAELCRRASAFTGIEVKEMLFGELPKNELLPVIKNRIICILSGQDRNCTDREIQRKNFIISCRKTCSRSMIRPDGRDMKYGIIKSI